MKEYLAIRLVFAALSALIAQGAIGGSQDVFLVSASIGRTHDSNLFKRPPDGSLGTVDSDDITTGRLNATARIPVSLQLFDLTAGVTTNDYRRFSQNDSTNENYSATWRWQMLRNLSGILATERLQTQTEFSDFRGDVQNQRTTDAHKFGANWSLTDQSTVGLAITGKKERNSQNFVQQESNRQTIGEISFRHSLPNGASGALTHSRSNGENADGTDFTLRNTDIHINWPLSNKTILSSKYGRVSRSNPGLESRDFSGNNGGIDLSWLATSKTTLTLSHVRTTESWLDTGSSFTVRDATSILVNWQASATVVARSTINRERQRFDGAPATNSRRDTTNRQSVTLEWAPWQNASIGGSIQNARRESNDGLFNYKDLTASLNGTMSF